MPTVGGVLLFGKERERDYPDARIPARRFQGADESRIADRVEIHSIPLGAVATRPVERGLGRPDSRAIVRLLERLRGLALQGGDCA